MVIEPQKQMASMRASQCEGTMWCLKPSESMCGAIPCKLPVVTVGVDKSDCSNTAAKLFFPRQSQQIAMKSPLIPGVRISCDEIRSEGCTLSHGF